MAPQPLILGQRIILWLCLAVTGLILIGCQPAPSGGLTVQVQHVISGQRFEVVGVAGQPEITEWVELAGIEVPDLAQRPWGELARQHMAHQIQGKPVRIEAEVPARGPQGQRMAYVWQDGRLLNEQLVAAGYALPATDSTSRYRQRLLYARDRARTLGLGIWNPQQPMRLSPSQFRQSQTGTKT